MKRKVQGRRRSAGGQEEGQSRQEPEDQVAQGARGQEAAARQGARARSRKPRQRAQGGGAAEGVRGAKPTDKACARRSQDSDQDSAKQALELLEAKVAEVKAQGQGGRNGRRGGKDAWLIPAEMPKEDAETRRTRLKTLIMLGKERGFLTYAEINDHLPDDLVDAEQIEAIISMLNDMGIEVYEQAPDAETLLIADGGATAATDEEAEEAAEAALSTVDSEFGRTTDPVRMYMREMGSVELLTREGEIEIAKRIEDGLKHMILAISRLPDHDRRDPAPRRQDREGRDAHRRGRRRPRRSERRGRARPTSVGRRRTIEAQIDEEEDEDGKRRPTAQTAEPRRS